MGVWAYGRMGVWAYGRMGVWAYGRMGVSAYGRMGVWAYRRTGVLAETLISLIRPISLIRRVAVAPFRPFAAAGPQSRGRGRRRERGRGTRPHGLVGLSKEDLHRGR
jgi:hypothetical protein